MPMPRIEQDDELEPDNGAGHTSYSVITGEYTSTPRWESRPVVVGAKVDKPTPVFTKLDPSVVEEELARAASL
jgi:methionyl-tRNA synthetase